MPHPKWHLQDKSILITGAAQGIGAAIARELVKQQARLTLVDTQGDTLQALGNELGGAILTQQADVTHPNELDAVVQKTLSQYGSIDIVVANAGIVIIDSALHSDPEAFSRVIQVNLIGAWNTLHATLPYVMATKGYILFISSLSGIIQGPLQGSYNASKAGIHALANTVRLEVEGMDVKVGVAYLTYVDTETGRAAVEHPSIQRLPGLRIMPPESVSKAAQMIVLGMQRRKRTIMTPSAHLALFAPDSIQRTIERLARRNKWAEVIHQQEQSATSFVKSPED